MGERRLAHIELIDWIKPIEGADKIELCGILGWQCVIAKKEGFKVGDKVIYVEVDSIMPDKPQFKFLEERKFRVRTIKLRGQISQGLVLSILSLPLSVGMLGKLTIGQDVTELLEITKYLTPSEKEEIAQAERNLKNANRLKKFMMRYSWVRRLFLSRTQKQGFPYWVNKTDEERIQNIPQVLTQFKDKYVCVTEKIDYQSVTFTGKMVSNTIPLIGKFLPKKYQFVVCSRNMTTNNKNSLYWQIAKQYNIENILRKHPNLTIQGEQGDTKVQGNKYGISYPQLWVFNIIDHDRNYFYSFEEMTAFCMNNGLQTVPFLFWGKLSECGTTVEEIINFTKGESTLAKIPREGMVFRCIDNGQKLLSFKGINPDFLLKFE